MRTGASGLPMFTEDTRVGNASNLPNGSFQITGASLSYDTYTGDMVHRLFHMWQQSDCSSANATPDNPSGCLNDLYPFVGVARNDGSGGNAMGFYNVNNDDAPVLKRLADEYTLNDNYHQPVMGGTIVQHTMIGTADAIPGIRSRGRWCRHRRASPIPIQIEHERRVQGRQDVDRLLRPYAAGHSGHRELSGNAALAPRTQLCGGPLLRDQ